MYSRILVPTDGSEFSDKAAKEAAKLAKELGSKLILFHAVPPYQLPPLTEGFSAPNRLAQKEEGKEEREAEAKQILAYAARNVNPAEVTAEQQFMVSNSPYDAIIKAAKKYLTENYALAIVEQS